MLCDECGKREAIVHIMQIGPDGRMERNLCEQCAGGIEKWIGEPLQGRKDVAANEFLQNIFRGTQEQKPAEEEPVLSCPYCGMSYADFQKNGKLGCPQCYTVYRKQLEPILRRVHGLSIHNGKIPSEHRQSTVEFQHEIVQLRAKLQKAVEQEEYEKAAEYRDILKAMEQRRREERPNGE